MVLHVLNSISISVIHIQYNQITGLEKQQFSGEKLCHYKQLTLIKKSINKYTAYKVFPHSVSVTGNDSVPDDWKIIRKHLLQFLNSENIDTRYKIQALLQI